MQYFPNERFGFALIHTASALALVLMTTVACAAGPESAPADQSANDRPAATAGQKIMLDPDTGEITQVPSQRAEEKASAREGAMTQQKASADDSSDPGGYKPWTTEDGTHMLATDPSTAASESVVRCPDGSLRMGHTARSDEDGSDSADTLCTTR